MVYGVTESRRIRGTELYRPEKTHSCTMEVTELCRTQADIKPMLDRTLVASQITEMAGLISGKMSRVPLNLRSTCLPEQIKWPKYH